MQTVHKLHMLKRENI